MKHSIFIYILIMALTTYAIRMLPLTLIKQKINNRFIRSFLHYVPYAALAAMTFPAILHSTDSVVSASIGFAVALFFSYRKKSLLTVALAACAAVFIVEVCLRFFL